MSADLKPYPAMKDSGVEWLGDVPKHWTTERFKSSMHNIVEQTTERRGTGLYVALEHVESWTGRLRHAGLDVSFDSQVKCFRSGDVLFGKLRPYLAKVTRPTSDGVCVGEFLVLRPRHSNATAPYMEQQLRSKPIIDAVNSSTFGAKMPRADWQFMGGMSIALPPLPEQAAIVRFLDHADRRIRRYIRAQQQLIALLEEQKQAIIHRAVTRGLDPNVRLKPSGVEWLGDVPEHWERRAVWQLFEIGRGKVTSHEYIANHSGSFPLYSSQTANDGVMGHIDTFMFDGDFLTWTTDGAHAGTVFRRSGKFNCTNVCGTLFPKTQFDLDFMRMAIASETKRQVRLDINPKLMNNMMARIRVSVPPYDEQVRITKCVQGIAKPSDSVIEQAQLQVGFFREYRTRLIADVVTGKLDVRAAAARLPGEVEELEPLDEADALIDGEEEPTDALATVP